MELISEQLIAPCGMNCGICSAYLAYKNCLPKVKGKITHCPGCRERNKKCAFLKKRCKDNMKLLKGEVDFCYECNCFPCENLEHLDEKYRNKYDMSMIKNLKEIQTYGIKSFIDNQYKKYNCLKCNGLISVHNKKCFNCDNIKSWNK